ncbi:MAG: archaellin/type IV pilin N-terminal domain-containing protein [Nitrososphaerales archaeon]
MSKVGKWKNKGVSPVIAVLLLIAIAISIGILTYVWASGLAGTLTTGYHTAQITESLTMVVYDAKKNLSAVNMTLRNVGDSIVNISRVYFDGTLLSMDTDGGDGEADDGCVDGGEVGWIGIPPATDRWIIINPPDTIAPGTAHKVLIVTHSGAKFQFIIIWGRVG